MFSTYLRKSSLSVFSLRSFTLKRPGRNEKVLVTSIYGSRSRRTPEEEEEFQQRNNEIKNFHTHVKELQIQPSIDIFREWKKKNNDPLQANIYNSLFSLFRKADHLPIATEIYSMMLADNHLPNESSHLALIRCHSDAGDTEKVYELLKSMFALENVEPKLRAYQPLLQTLCMKDKNPYRAVEVVQEMIARNIIASGDDLKMLLVVAHLTNAYSNVTFSMELNRIIDALSVHLVGFMSSEALSLVSAYRNIILDEVVKEGVLVQDIDIIREFSENILSDNRTIDGTVIAMNASYTRLDEASSKSSEANISMWKDIVDVEDSEWDSSEQDDYVEYLPEMYTFKTNSGTSNININSSNSNVFGRKMNNESNNRTNINKQIVDENQNDYDFDDTNSFINQADILNARIFDVSSTRCACPNCGDTLLLPLLSHEERLSVKSALMDLITERKSPKKLAYIQNFEKWLEENGPYKYIVDGANVGYNRQNCANGRFSYEQIELVVKKLQSRDDGRVLVLLPEVYASSRVIPNRVRHKNKRGTSNLSFRDTEILRYLAEANALYAVPAHVNDDWFWIYASMTSTRKNAWHTFRNSTGIAVKVNATDTEEYPYIVSNDLTRDHRKAFAQPRGFARWRASQIIPFRIMQPVESQLPLEINDIEFLDPKQYSREIQRGSFSWRWHFPIADRRAWLCLNLLPN